MNYFLFLLCLGFGRFVQPVLGSFMKIQISTYDQQEIINQSLSIILKLISTVLANSCLLDNLETNEDIRFKLGTLHLHIVKVILNNWPWTFKVIKVDGTVSQKYVYKNSRLWLEYAYLLIKKFIMNRINSELIQDC